MVRFSEVTKDQLNALWHDTYGWVTSAGVHFIADAYTVVSFWTTGEIDVYGINTDETSTSLKTHIFAPRTKCLKCYSARTIL